MNYPLEVRSIPVNVAIINLEEEQTQAYDSRLLLAVARDSNVLEASWRR